MKDSNLARYVAHDHCDTSKPSWLVLAMQNAVMKTRFSPVWLFASEFLANRSAIGAVCPSSRKLAERMASLVPANDDGLIVELGGGTGVVTSALLGQGVSMERLVVVEKSANLAQYLRKRFPHIRVIHGDAVYLRELLETNVPVRVVVSSLPLRSLPSATVAAISQQLENVLTPGGILIQFTYHLENHNTLLPERFKKVASKVTWRNLPPARVEAFLMLEQ